MNESIMSNEQKILIAVIGVVLILSLIFILYKKNYKRKLRAEAEEYLNTEKKVFESDENDYEDESLYYDVPVNDETDDLSYKELSQLRFQQADELFEEMEAEKEWVEEQKRIKQDELDLKADKGYQYFMNDTDYLKDKSETDETLKAEKEKKEREREIKATMREIERVKKAQKSYGKKKSSGSYKGK